MRIAIATLYGSLVGGVETYLRALVPLLRARGHDVALGYEIAGGGAPVTDDAAVPRWSLSDAAGMRALEAFRPDVVYMHGLGTPALDAELAARFPVVLFMHDYSATCVSGYKRHARLTPGPCARRLGPACLALYGPCGCGGLNPATALSLYARARRKRALLPRVRRVVTASAHMRDEYVRNGAPADRTSVLPLFPTDVRPLPARDRRAPRDAIHVAMIGRLTALKGGEELVEALALTRDALPKPIALVVAGDGARRAAMEERARRAGVNARFAGELGPAERDAVLADADLLVVPSVWPEPFGLVGIEAATFGVPAVAFDVGGVRDWLRPGVSGELAPGDPPTPRGLADAIVRALRDPAYVARLSDGARAVAAAFSAERHLVDLEAILAAAAASPPP